MEPAEPNKQILIDLITTKMPFGKFQGRLIADLPEFYLVWFKNKSWPPGKIGYLMQNCYEIKIQGMEPILQELKKVYYK